MAVTDTISTYYLRNVYTEAGFGEGIYGAQETSAPIVSSTYDISGTTSKTLLTSVVVRPFERWNIYQFMFKVAMVDLSTSATVKAVIYRDFGTEGDVQKVYESSTQLLNTTSTTNLVFGSSSTVAYTVDNFSLSQPDLFYIGLEIVSNNGTIRFSTFGNDYTDFYTAAPALNGTFNILTSSTPGFNPSPSTPYSYITAKVSDLLPVSNPTLTSNTNGSFTLNYTFPTSDRAIIGEYAYFKSSDSTSPVQPSIITAATNSVTLEAATSGSINSSAGGNAGDIALVFINTNGTAPATPSGWTLLKTENHIGGGSYSLFFKRMAGIAAESFAISGVSLATNAAYLRITNASTTTDPRVYSKITNDTGDSPTGYTNINYSLSLSSLAMTNISDSSLTAPSPGYTIARTQTNTTATDKNTLSIASKTITTTNGIEKPPLFTGFTIGSRSHINFTVVVDPFVSSLSYTNLNQAATSVTFTPTDSPVNNDKYWVYARYRYGTNTPTAPTFNVIKSVSGTYAVVVAPTTNNALTLSSPTTTSVNIQNTANSNGGSAITRWKLERSLDQSTWTSTEYAPGATNLNFNQTQTGLSENTTYFYRLSASNTATSPYVFGTPTPVGSVTTGRTVTPPSAPTFTTNTVTTDIYGTVSVSLGWSVSSMGTGTFTKYQITRSPSFATPTTKEQTPSFYTDTDNLKSGGTATVSGQQYTYTVTVVTTDGSASSSITVNVPGGRYAYFDGTSWQVRYLRNHNDSADIDIFVYNPTWNTTGGWQKIRNN